MTDLMTPSKEQDAIESARSAGLRYVSDQKPGIRRERVDDTFVYIDPKGNRMVIFRRLAAIQKAANNTATINAGAKSVTKRSTSA